VSGTMLGAQTRLQCSQCRVIPLARRYASSSTGQTSLKQGAIDESEEWETIIGLEIHAQIRTGRKLFSSTSESLD
jgi:hypothetical protein